MEVPGDLLEQAKAYTGGGVTEAVRAGLRKRASSGTRQELLTLRGEVKFSVNPPALREDED